MRNNPELESHVRHAVPENISPTEAKMERKAMEALFNNGEGSESIDRAVFSLFRGKRYVMLNGAIDASELNEAEFSLEPKSIDLGAAYLEIIKNDPYPEVVGVTIDANILKNPPKQKEEGQEVAA